MSEKAIVYKDDLGQDWEETDIPADHVDVAHEARTHLIEAIADYDDELMEAYLSDEAIDVARLKAAIRKATLDISMTPVLCGSSFKNKGVQPLLDAVIDYLPSPLDVPPMEGLAPGSDEGNGNVLHREPKDDEPFSALAFKVMSDPFVGKLTYFRVYSGKLSAGSRVLNANTGRTERVGRILMMHANHREDQDEVYAGDIAAAVGLKQTSTGDTLCAPDAPIRLETMTFPEPVVHLSIEPKTKADQEKMSTALARLAEEDPTFQVRTDDETGQTVISGMGELHLEVLVDRMKREFRVEAAVGRPQVAYRETVRGEATKVEGKFIRQTGGSGQYGVVYIDIEPAPGEGFDFINKIKGGSIPSEFIPAVEKGIEEALETGVKAGFPMVDVRVTLTDGKYHDTDSSEIAFKIAGLAGPQGGRQARQARAARADHGGRGGHAAGVPRRRDRRPVTPPRPRGGPGAAGQRPRREGQRAASRDVRLRDRSALHHPGPRAVHDAVRPLRGSPQQPRRGNRRSTAPESRWERVLKEEYVSGVRLLAGRRAF